MPFAPAVLAEHGSYLYHNWTEQDVPSKYMTMTFAVTDKHKELAPATVHVDGTARPQIVRHSDNPRFYNILHCYYRLTGIPIIINTSFNIHEEPIVNSPEDALGILKHDAVDILILNDYLVDLG
jgi:carbamoyltransferase